MRRVLGVVIFVVLLVAVLGGFYYARNPERETLDDTARKTAPG